MAADHYILHYLVHYSTLLVQVHSTPRYSQGLRTFSANTLKSC